MSRMEILGAEELIYGGDDYDDLDDVLGAYELVGAAPMTPRGFARGRAPARGLARRAPSPAFNRALQTATAAKMAGAGLVVKTSEPTKARRLVLPMASTGTVAAGTSATITSRPQTIAFKPQRVVIPASIAPDFTIEDIKVGNTSQLAQSGSLPAEAFVQTAFDVEMDMDTVQTSQDFVIQLTNISGAARTFRAAIYGRSAQ
jgi:hypothetical protein